MESWSLVSTTSLLLSCRKIPLCHSFLVLIRPAQVLRTPPDLLVELASFHELFDFNNADTLSLINSFRPLRLQRIDQQRAHQHASSQSARERTRRRAKVVYMQRGVRQPGPAHLHPPCPQPQSWRKGSGRAAWSRALGQLARSSERDLRLNRSIYLIFDQSNIHLSRWQQTSGDAISLAEEALRQGGLPARLLALPALPPRLPSADILLVLDVPPLVIRLPVHGQTSVCPSTARRNIPLYTPTCRESINSVTQLQMHEAL